MNDFEIRLAELNKQREQVRETVRKALIQENELSRAIRLLIDNHRVLEVK